jgi:hypothetical protein
VDGGLIGVGAEVLPASAQCGRNPYRHRGPPASRVVW